MNNRLAEKYFIFASILLIWLGFAIRLHNLGGDSMWWDEIATTIIAREGLETALQATRDHPPLTYLLTAVSINIWNENEFAARLPAFFAGVLTIPILLALGKILRRPWIGIWAALFLVFSPFHLKYSQEVRHYTLLLLFSLSSYAILYRAVRKPRPATWVAYSLLVTLMLYTHYSGFVVLATQLLIALIWIIQQGLNKQGLNKQNIGRYTKIIPALSLIPLLYLPWLTRFLAALSYNTSEETLTGTGTATSLLNWGREIFSAFGMNYGWRPWLFITLVILGILLWIKIGRPKNVVFVLLGMFLPLLLIQLVNVTRGAFARYIIYLLPFYLLLAAIVPVTVLKWLTRQQLSSNFMAATLFLAALFGISSLEPLENEYEFVQSDWNGIVQYLADNGQPDDIVVGLTLSHANGFNPAHFALPYYLERHGNPVRQLLYEDFEVNKLQSLPETGNNIYLVLSNWDTPTQFEDPSLTVNDFSYFLYIVEDKAQNRPLLDTLIYLYEQTLTITQQPLAFCLLYSDLAALETAAGRYLVANDWLQAARTACANIPIQVTSGVRGDTKTALFDGLLSELETATLTGNVEDARTLAALLLTFDPKHPAALETLTAVNLQQQFQQGLAEIDQNQAPEPVSIRPFIMPNSGDNGDVLFIHPPATAAFEITLPETPVTFSSRIALAPESWAWGGDGVTFVLRLKTAAGYQTELLRQHIENTPPNQTWHDITLSLAEYAGQTITLMLTTENGPAGNGTGDWAGWETPRLLYQTTTP